MNRADQLRVKQTPTPVLLLSLLLLVVTGAQAGSLDLDHGWEYRWGDSPFSATGVALWTQQPDDPHWSSIDFPSNPPGRLGQKNVWFRITLPEGQWRDPVLYIFSVDLIVQVYLDSQRIYEYGHFNADGSGQFEGWPWHMITLPADCAGKELYFRVFSDYMDIGLWGEVRLMERLDLLRDIVANSLDRLIASGFSLLIALLALIFALVQREQRGFGAIALFALVSGTMVLSDSQANFLLFHQALVWNYLGAISYFLIPVAMASLLRQWLYPAYQRLFDLVLRLGLLYCLGAVVLSLSGVVSLSSAYPVFDYLLTLMLVVLLIPVARFLPRADSNQRLILGAYAVLSLLLLLDMAVAHSWLPWSRIPIAWGTLLFALSVVFVALRHYARMQSELRVMNSVLEQRVQQRTAELEELATHEFARAELLELENSKRGEQEDLIAALQGCALLRDALELLSQRLPTLCNLPGGALYRLSEDASCYQRAANWGALGVPPTLPLEWLCARELDTTSDHRPWRFPIFVDDPRQSSPLCLLLVHPPVLSDTEQNSLDVMWYRLIERGVERIGLTLSQLRLRETLRALSYEDGLSGLQNRRFLDEMLPHEIALAQRQGTPLSLIICDIDHFKRFNDTHGHDAGDAVSGDSPCCTASKTGVSPVGCGVPLWRRGVRGGAARCGCRGLPPDRGAAARAHRPGRYRA